MIYLDYAAGSPLTVGVAGLLDSMGGNASSVHDYGFKSRLAIEEARMAVAYLLGADTQQIVFTSGGTEANHLALNGREVVAFSSASHSSVLSAGSKAPIAISLPVGAECLTQPEGVLSAARSADIVSLIHMNNETGAIEPVMHLAEMIKALYPNTLIHVDAVQSFGKLSLQWVYHSKVDFLSVSGHKIGALPGVGALYVKNPDTLIPIFPGSQEMGQRAGTENVLGIVSLGAACGQQWAGARNYLELKQVYMAELTKLGAEANAPFDNASPVLSVRFPNIDAEILLQELDYAGIAASAGSACAARNKEPSHVLTAMGLTPEQAASTIRLSFGPGSVESDIPTVIQALKEGLEIAKDYR